MIQLPGNNEVVKAVGKSPQRTLIFSFPKAGKSSMCLQLKNSLLIDLESGTSLYEGTKISLKEQMKNTGKSDLATLKLITEALKKDPRDYIIVDTVTELEDMALRYAVHLYKKSLQGRNYQGDNLLADLGQNAYSFIRDAFAEMMEWFEGTYTKGIIYLCHIKLASITKGEKDIQVKDIQLLGKNKSMLAKDCDAIGCLMRNKDNLSQNILSFKTNPNDIVSGARSPHLANKEFVISEMKDGKLNTDWDKIFID